MRKYHLHPYVATDETLTLYVVESLTQTRASEVRPGDIAFDTDTGYLYFADAEGLFQPVAFDADVQALEAAEGHPTLSAHVTLGLVDTTALAAAIAAHVAAIDPHDGYELSAMKGTAFGYASLNGSAKVPIIELPIGTGSLEAAAGDHGHAQLHDEAHDHDADYEATGAVAAHTADGDAHHAESHDHDADYAALGHTHAAQYITQILTFTPIEEDLASGSLMPIPGICVGESGEHGTISLIRAKALCETAGSGTNTIVIEADDNPAFSSPTVIYTLALDTSTEVDDVTQDNTWSTSDIFIRARCTAVDASPPANVVVFVYMKQQAEAY